MYLFKMRMHVERRSPYFRQMKEFYEGRERENTKRRIRRIRRIRCVTSSIGKSKNNKNVVSIFAEYQ
jgi:hypothetical protein